MYIGKWAMAPAPDDGIYVLLKETIDNSLRVRDGQRGRTLM